MSAPYTRGGIPRHFNASTGAGVTRAHTWNDQGAAGGVANYLWFKNTGAGALTLAFTQAAANASQGITLAAGAVWEGPTEIDTVYTRAVADQTFEAVAFVRRG